jgi:hypothetical protein
LIAFRFRAGRYAGAAIVDGIALLGAIAKQAVITSCIIGSKPATGQRIADIAGTDDPVITEGIDGTVHAGPAAFKAGVCRAVNAVAAIKRAAAVTDAIGSAGLHAAAEISVIALTVIAARGETEFPCLHRDSQLEN